MLILLFILSVIALIVFCVLQFKFHSGDTGSHLVFVLFSWISGFIALISLWEICDLSTTVFTESTIDNKIKMYQEENANIEQDIDKIVKEYLKHEHDTYADLKTEESSITLVTLFPDLKSDNLVQQQLEIYVKNNSTIKSLRKEKIDISKKKWLLYFGK